MSNRTIRRAAERAALKAARKAERQAVINVTANKALAANASVLLEDNNAIENHGIHNQAADNQAFDDQAADDQAAADQASENKPHKSTGPRTEAGKQTSSRNAIKHGLCSVKTLILPNESITDYMILEGKLVPDVPSGSRR